MLRYAITDRGRAGEEGLLRQVARLAEAGVDFVQLREKDLEPAALVVLARRVLAVLRSYPTGPKLLINSRADVAVAVGADGVHLTSAAGSLSPTDVRAVFAAVGRPEPIVSVSCHTVAGVAAVSGSDLILFGPVFEKVVADGGCAEVVAEGAGLDLLQLACAAAAPTPVLALGGITLENAAATLAAGVAGIAGIRLFMR